MQQREEEKNKRKTEFCFFFFLFFFISYFPLDSRKILIKLQGLSFREGGRMETASGAVQPPNQAVNQRAVYYIIIIMGFSIHIFL